MLSHVQEDDDTYPSPAPDGYEYWSRTIKGKSFRVYLRRPRGSGAGEQEQTILDVNEVLTPANPDANASPGSNPDSNPDPDANPDSKPRQVATLPYFQNEEGWDAAQCDVHEVETSPSGKLLAYAVDGSGYVSNPDPGPDPNPHLHPHPDIFLRAGDQVQGGHPLL
jgi:oligopeptidase B